MWLCWSSAYCWNYLNDANICLAGFIIYLRRILDWNCRHMAVLHRCWSVHMTIVVKWHTCDWHYKILPMLLQLVPCDHSHHVPDQQWPQSFDIIKTSEPSIQDSVKVKWSSNCFSFWKMESSCYLCRRHCLYDFTQRDRLPLPKLYYLGTNADSVVWFYI